MIDPLTEVNNRQILDYDLPEVIKKTEAKVALGVIFLDLDNFKKINDTYGHPIGDKVLKSLAKSLSNSVRKNDVIIRYGGEEFVIIAFDVTNDSLAVMAEKIRVLVESSSVREENNDICFTISIGATMIQSKDTLSSAIKRGDDYMYESKKNGKNRVTIR
jgi:diguanylate cyclase (GGDEF)-like protein